LPITVAAVSNYRETMKTMERSIATTLATAPGTPSSPFPLAVRIDAAGNVLESQGDLGELASIAAYVSQVAQLVGGELGLGRFMALHAVDDSQQIIIGAEPSGETMALCGPRHLAATALCNRLGL
jgi:hypothetical protein